MAEETQDNSGLSDAELAAEEGVALPDKEVVSILDLNADLNLAIDAAAPIDLAAAANANVAAPIDAAVGANVLSVGSTAQSLADQGASIDQGIVGDSTAHATQDSTLDQGGTTDAASSGDTAGAAPAATSLPTDGTGDVGSTVGDVVGTVGDVGGTTGDVGGTVGDVGGTVGDVGGTVGDVGSGVGSIADGNLLNVDVNLDANANIAAPINGAIAANANVAAPIDASVAANVGSVDSDAVSIAQQDAIIHQNIDGNTEATSDQQSDISQPDQPDSTQP